MRAHTTRLGRTAAAAALGAALLAGCTSPPPVETPYPWEEAREPSPGQLVVSFWGSPPLSGPDDFCGADYHGAATETTRSVTVSVVQRMNLPPDPDGISCPAVAAWREVRITLEAPVGTRVLIDGATGERHELTEGPSPADR